MKQNFLVVVATLAIATLFGMSVGFAQGDPPQNGTSSQAGASASAQTGPLSFTTKSQRPVPQSIQGSGISVFTDFLYPGQDFTPLEGCNAFSVGTLQANEYEKGRKKIEKHAITRTRVSPNNDPVDVNCVNWQPDNVIGTVPVYADNRDYTPFSWLTAGLLVAKTGTNTRHVFVFSAQQLVSVTHLHSLGWGLNGGGVGGAGGGAGSSGGGWGTNTGRIDRLPDYIIYCLNDGPFLPKPSTTSNATTQSAQPAQPQQTPQQAASTPTEPSGEIADINIKVFRNGQVLITPSKPGAPAPAATAPAPVMSAPPPPNPSPEAQSAPPASEWHRFANTGCPASFEPLVIVFPKDSTTIAARDNDVIIRFSHWLGQHPNCLVQVVGNASREGPTQHNSWLGEARAAAVYWALVRVGNRLGFDLKPQFNRWPVVSAGSRVPVDSADDLPPNRRVVVQAVTSLASGR